MMRCDRCRSKLQEWFDEPGTPALSGDVAEHVKVCGDCRAFITSWNTIELRMQALRAEAPSLSADFIRALHVRLAMPQVKSRRRIPVRAWRFAAAGAGSAVVLAGILYAASSLRSLASVARRSPSIILSQPTPRIRSASPSAGLTPGLPLAETRPQ